ncbi:hypothetical protein NLX71_21955 [Paenibacillus sp. MZ04-78.2]|uniref:hypothetical protein n=1 Tax=Paenibacillus sp. MZ04-78.2 TaxID=2962034 RepID=UPI0020B6B9BD|nr:hypothetical protein [Paenibacillus sp. MZ04-78.2]MCP3775936.1 hypothetical protein [Paenibacillus sp. MZ04-78.2]
MATKLHPFGSPSPIEGEPQNDRKLRMANFACDHTFNASYEALAACVCLRGGGMLFL